MKNILCFGDSNTWGATPGTLKRFPKDIRWTGVLARELGEDYYVLDDGINGRRTVWDDPGDQCRNGLAALGYTLYRAKPLDLVIVMLGTNDLHHTDAEGYYRGIRTLGERVLKANACYPGTSDVFPEKARLLLISPIEILGDMHAESLRFPEMTARAAQELGVEWLNAADYAVPDPADNCHMAADSHLRLGKAIAQKVLEILA